MSETNTAAQLGPCSECDRLVWGRRTYRTLGSITSLDRDHCKTLGRDGQGVVYFHEPPEGR
jgi:hypothetical protein